MTRCLFVLKSQYLSQKVNCLNLRVHLYAAAESLTTVTTEVLSWYS